MEAVMEGWELRGGSALGLGDWSHGLSFTLLTGSDDGSCFVTVTQNYFLTDAPDLPVMCVFSFPVLQLQCRTGQDRIYWCCDLV